MTAIVCAKTAAVRAGQIQEHNQFVIFISEEAHYSFAKSALVTGIGLASVIKIKSDEQKRMSVPHLEKAVEDQINLGKAPLLIAATAGAPPCLVLLMI